MFALCDTEDEIIRDFLWIDSCAKLADKVSKWLFKWPFIGGGREVVIA